MDCIVLYHVGLGTERIIMNIDSSRWLSRLRGSGPDRPEALRCLHALMLRAAIREAYRRGPNVKIAGPELDDLATQAADDAMMALLVKLQGFHGESRFTTWAYRFVVFEVAKKVDRHAWRRPVIHLDRDEWQQLPASFASDPLVQTIQSDLLAAVRSAFEEALTERQRQVFFAIAVHGTPLESVAAESGSTRGAIYKTVFDARRKIRAHLTAHGYIEDHAHKTGLRPEL